MNDQTPAYREFRISRTSALAWIVIGLVLAALSPLWWYFNATGEGYDAIMMMPVFAQAFAGAVIAFRGFNTRRRIIVVSRNSVSVSGGIHGMGNMEIGWGEIRNWRVTSVQDPLSKGSEFGHRKIFAVRFETRSGKSHFITEDDTEPFEEFVAALRDYQPALEVVESSDYEA